MAQTGRPGVPTKMGSTGNFYERIRASKRHTAQADALTGSQAQSTQIKISSAGMKRAASTAFTGLAMTGWLLLALLAIDTILFNGKLLTEVLARL